MFKNKLFRNNMHIKDKYIVKKFFSICICVSMMLMLLPTKESNFMVQANSVSSNIPTEFFVTKDGLLKLCSETNGGAGLLSSGVLATEVDTEDNPGRDRKLRINFGTRRNETEYYLDSSKTTSIAAKNKPMTWLIAGYDKAENSKNGGLVLYSEEPMISSGEIVNNSNSKFGGNTWEESNLRNNSQKIYNSFDYFTDHEKELILSSTINNGTDIQTKDFLYAANAGIDVDTVTIGETDNLIVDSSYLNGLHWLRSISTSGIPQSVCADKGVEECLDEDGPANSFALKLNVNDISFLSSACISSEKKFTVLNDDMAMIPRFYSPGKTNAKIGITSEKIAFKNANGWTLMIQGVTSEGINWVYNDPILTDDFTDITCDDIISNCSKDFPNFSLDSFNNCKVWLEHLSDNNLTYAIYSSLELPEPDLDISNNENDIDTEDIIPNQSQISNNSELTEKECTDYEVNSSVLKTGDKSLYFLFGLCVSAVISLGGIFNLRKKNSKII